MKRPDLCSDLFFSKQVVFLDMLGLLSEDSLVLSAYFNNTLGSAYKITSTEIQNEILDSVI